MVDTQSKAHPLSAACLALGARVAVAGGAACALLSLLFDAPVWVASLRGAAVWFALRWLARLTARSAVATLDPGADSTPPASVK